MAMVSRWPVACGVVIRPEELDADGRLTEAGAQRVFAHARDIYFDECTTLEGVELTTTRSEVFMGSAPVVGATVTVATGVVEIYPDSFTMRARIRAGESDLAAEGQCLLTVAGELPKACVDEFIARAHDARHMG